MSMKIENKNWNVKRDSEIDIQNQESEIKNHKIKNSSKRKVNMKIEHRNKIQQGN